MSRASRLQDRPRSIVGLHSENPFPSRPSARFIPPPAPDGWSPVRLSTQQAIGFGIAGFLAAASERVGRQISRRRFLGRVTKAALVAGMGLDFFLWNTERASAIPEICCGPMQLGCGPSELCPLGTQCSGGQCNTSDPSVKKRANLSGVHPGRACPNPVLSNWWNECCPDGMKKCCDCCVGACAACTSCTGTCSSKKKCICRSLISPPPCMHDPRCP